MVEPLDAPFLLRKYLDLRSQPSMSFELNSGHRLFCVVGVVAFIKTYFYQLGVDPQAILQSEAVVCIAIIR